MRFLFVTIFLFSIQLSANDSLISSSVSELKSASLSDFKFNCSELTQAGLYKFKNKIKSNKALLAKFYGNLKFILFQKSINKAPDISQVFVNQMQQKASLMSKELDKKQQCLFRFELNAQLENISKSEPNSHNVEILKSLKSITECLGNSRIAIEQGQKFRGVFTSIFNFFNGESSRRDLTPEECKTLQKTYSVWSSFYDSLNQSQEDSPDSIPLYNVNAHNSSYGFWLQEQASGRIPEGGIPLLHADTHTDFSHIHLYPNDKRFKRVPWSNLQELLKTSTVGTKEELIAKINELRQVGRDVEEGKLDRSIFRPISTELIDDLITWVNQSDIAEVRSTLMEVSKANIHKIAQPLTAAVSSGLTSDILMVMPPWSKRLKRTTPSTPPINVHLSYQRGYLDPEISPSLEPSSSDATKESPFIPNNGSPRVPDSNFRVHVTDLSSEVVTQPPADDQSSVSPIINYDEQASAGLPSFDQYMPNSARETGFILDIDMDAFVSNGYKDDIIEPKSYGRDYSSHETTSEGDLRSGLATREMELIKQRVNEFFRRLEEAKSRGVLPKVITIADSTQLSRAIRGENEDFTGGNFTPACLAFMLNFMIREKLKSLYPGVSLRN